jgi:Carboxypeptidase regulatory-like domain
MKIGKFLAAVLACFLSILSVSGLAQSTGTLRGTVTFSNTGKPIHNVRVTITQLKRSVLTNDDGTYEFQNVPPWQVRRGGAPGPRSRCS